MDGTSVSTTRQRRRRTSWLDDDKWKNVARTRRWRRFWMARHPVARGATESSSPTSIFHCGDQDSFSGAQQHMA